MSVKAISAKSLFQATKPKAPPHPALIADLARHDKPRDARDVLDYDPTPPEATEALLSVEGAHIRAHGLRVWEPAVGAGHIAKVLVARGFEVVGNDVVDRGWPGVELRDFFTVQTAPAPIHITNPPYNRINARDGGGAWLRHALGLGAGYVALLLNADWPAARINGMDALLRDHPPSVEWLCCWKIDFRGGGSPPQRNSWFVWDVNRPAPASGLWLRGRLFRDGLDPDQGVML